MSHVDTEDLNKVLLICETEEDRIEAEEFLKQRHLSIGTKAIVLECNIEDFEMDKDLNYSILENTNKDFTNNLFNYFIKINKKTSIIKIK